jgi:hypothetical protein
MVRNAGRGVEHSGVI